jgi:AcrR family transcriptional regulator
LASHSASQSLAIWPVKAQDHPGEVILVATRVTRLQQARQTRQRIIDTATRLFAQRGYDGTSLQLIADEMGMTKAAVYHHFRTKAEIQRAISAPAREAAEQLLDAAAGKRGKHDRIELMAGGLVEILLNQRGLVTIIANDPALRGRLKAESAAMDDLRERAVRVIFGDSPTVRQRAAVYLTGALADVLPFLNDADEDELREVLTEMSLRLLRSA